jgi:hypothetical protein
MRAKLLFNSALFFTGGIISLLRSNIVELIISISFSLLFLSLHLLMSSSKHTTAFE